MGISLDSIASNLHSIEIKDASGQALAIDGSGFLTIANTSFAVTSTDLDIRNLLFATDKVDVSGSSNVDVTATDLDIRNLLFATDKADVSGSSNVGVTGSDFDIRDLVFATDKVDVSGSSIVTSPDNISTWKTSELAVTSTAAEAAATPLAGRGKAIFQNIGSNDVYLSDTNAVSSTDLLLPKGASFEMNFESDANIWAATASGTATMKIAEFAA